MVDRSAPMVRIRRLLPGGSPQRIALFDNRILSVTIHDESGKADKIEIELDNRDLALLERGAADSLIGRAIQLQFGYFGELSPPRKAIMMRMKITGNGDRVRLIGFSESIRLSRRARVRSWSQVKRSDVAKIIAEEWGYTTQYIEETEIVVESIQQRGESDAHFLRRLARREGFVFRVDDRGFHFRDENWSHPVAKRYRFRQSAEFISWSAGEVDYLRYESKTQAVSTDPGSGQEGGVAASRDEGDGIAANDDDAVTSFGSDDDEEDFPTDRPVGYDAEAPPPRREPARSAGGRPYFDPAGQAAVEAAGGVAPNFPTDPDAFPVLAGAGRLNLDEEREPLAPGEEAINYNPDGTTVRAFYDPARETAADQNQVLFGPNRNRTEREENIEAESLKVSGTAPAVTEREAKARFVWASRRRIKLGVKFIGDPALRSDRMIGIDGIGPIFSGDYYIQSVKHVLAENYNCDLSLRAQGDKKRGPGGDQDVSQDELEWLTYGGEGPDDDDEGW